MGNLLSNACKFAPDGTTVTLGAELHDVGPRFYVRDQGPGVPPSFVPSLFEPFTRADNSDTREKNGTGLGLSIAREIVERMSGNIGYRRTDDNLTEFWITLNDIKALEAPKASLRLVK
ncbi:sensor histidine kinase [Thioclava sp. FR2]|uniref:sensor histidine kinase n=1 Tax=Thioclava sp. FR2 TaxID=3445780 RepID=UPI003EB80A9E